MHRTGVFDICLVLDMPKYQLVMEIHSLVVLYMSRLEYNYIITKGIKQAES